MKLWSNFNFAHQLQVFLIREKIEREEKKKLTQEGKNQINYDLTIS